MNDIEIVLPCGHVRVCVCIITEVHTGAGCERRCNTSQGNGYEREKINLVA